MKLVCQNTADFNVPIRNVFVNPQHVVELKEAMSRFRIQKSLAKILQIRRLQSVLIFPILNLLCSFRGYYYTFCVFLS